MISIPFSGSKRYSYKNVKPIVEAGDYDTVFEPFGGSCVLSANLYNDGYVNRAVVNDYDGLFDIYPQYLDYKDWIVEECLNYGIKRRTGGSGDPYPYYYDENNNKCKVELKLAKDEKDFLQSLIAQVPQKYWKLLALGNNFAHSAVSSHEVIRLSDFCYFQRYIKTDKQRAYLEVIDKLERVSLDYLEFIERYKPEFNENTLLIVDPPYCKTAQKQYKDQFTETQTIELLKLLKSLDVDFIFFNHDRERVVDWLIEAGISPESIELTGNTATTANGKRKDVMVFVKRKDFSLA